MIKCALFLIFVSVSTMIGRAQDDLSKEKEAFKREIDEKVYRLRVDPLTSTFAPSDSLLRQFITKNPQFLALFEGGEHGVLPSVSYSVLDSSVVRVEFYYAGSFARRRLIWSLMDEKVLNSADINEEYIPPSAMRDCDSWAGSNVHTYYKDNLAYVCFVHYDSCSLPISIWAEGVPANTEWIDKLIDFVHELEKFKGTN